MKILNLIFIGLGGLCLPIQPADAQGSLAPPGPPGPTMLTLSQVEPRTPISSLPYTISQPGSYYLAANLVSTVSNAIVINTNGVTLDLNGFTISSSVANAANGGAAVLLNSGLSDITVCNGHIRGGVTNNGSGVYSGSGFGYGVFAGGNAPENVLVSRVSVSGCLYDGIYLDDANSTLVESCTVKTAGNAGIFASTVKQATAIDCGGSAISGDQVFDSRGTSNANGIVANFTAQNCYGSSSSDYAGVAAANVQNCYGTSVSDFGINGSSVLNSYGYSNSDVGIVANTAENCYGYSNGGAFGVYANEVASGCYGYSVSGTGLDAFIASVCHANGFTVMHNVNSF